ncbi:hypothetical protein [Leucobacter ruminantium]|uniref:hypothetical protein n=1 Tax=Leucobacter ruminantium TaxID=1289170 RepID=UPI003132D56B
MPDEITANDLYPAARNELKTLQAEVQERVARHLATALVLLDEDPELAHQHALSASRRAGRIPVAREFLAMTAYRIGDFALALRELRTYRRLSGRDNHVALMVECERGLNRPEKGIETGLAVDAKQLDTEQRVHLAIAMSGARLDMGQTQQALFELEIPELDPNRGFSWSPELFAAYAAVLEELGRSSEAAEWNERADRAALALEEHLGGHDELDVFEVVEMDLPEEAETEADEADADGADGGGLDTGEAESEETEADEADTDEADARNEPAEPDRAVEAAPLSFHEEVAAEVDELLAEAGIGAGTETESTDSTEDEEQR